MFRLTEFPLATLAVFSLAALLTGCGGGAAFPDIEPTPARVSGGGFQGNDYGGHAPLVGARVFVLQAGTGGYGATATSLLSAGETTTGFYGNTYTTALDSVAGSPTNGMYYITTDSKGAFNITGDYTCTSGDPVYLYASGGNPSTIPAVTLTSVNAVAGTGTYAGDTLVTFQNSGTSLIYQGESIEFAGITGAFAGFNYTSTPVGYTVVSPATFGSSQTLTINQFTVVVVGSTFTASQDFTSITPAPTAFQSAANAPNNPAVVNVALLGICPATGAKNFSSLNFVYMNEVSTVAAATAMAPFTAVSSSQNDAVHIGTSSTNLIGLQNAVYNAANLYDIQGSVSGSGGDGETHIAFATTPNGAGTVPQSLLNTIANILANCVDSANTYNAATATGGVASVQCSALFSNATSDGTTGGTVPNDTATAAINVARFPDGTTSNASFVSNIYNSLTGNAPFQPSLSAAPHDFAIGILFSTPGNLPISDVQIDGSGNIWIVGYGSNQVFEATPQGIFTYHPPSGSTVSNATLAGLDITATSAHIYVPAGSGMLVFVPGTYTGTVSGTGNTVNGSQVTGDASGNLYVANAVPGAETTSYVQKSTIAGVAAGGNFPINSTCTYQVQYVTMDASYNLWTNMEYSVGNTICRYAGDGTLQYSLVIPGSTFPLSYGLGVDAGGNLWFSEKDNNQLYKIAYGTATTGNTVCNAAAGCTAATGGTISAPLAVAIDGANSVWITNSGASPAGISQFSNAGVAITPTFLSGTGYGNDYLFLKVDQSGSVWGVGYQSNAVVQYIGVATPTAQPLSYARANGKLGARP